MGLKQFLQVWGFIPKEQRRSEKPKMSSEVDYDPAWTQHQRVMDFINDPNYPENLRRNAALSYYPDRQPPELREDANRILAEINDICDRLERERKK